MVREDVSPTGVPALRDWNDGSDAIPCIWTGISCRAIPGLQEDQVVDITLPRYALGGTLAPSLGNLAYLETLDLDSNQLGGRIPGLLPIGGGSNWTLLERLDLSVNHFYGNLKAIQ